MGILRGLLKLACLVLMGYLGYYLWVIDIAQTHKWVETDHVWLESMSRGIVAFFGAFIAGALAWQAVDGFLALFERK